MCNFYMHSGQRHTKRVAGAAEKRDGDKAGHTIESLFINEVCKWQMHHFYMLGGQRLTKRVAGAA